MDTDNSRHESAPSPDTAAFEAPPTFGDFAQLFARIGCLSFGGPAGQIALMHHEVVDRRGWIGEADYLQALSLCHLLPGPEAQQLATWIGWRLHGVRGGLTAGLLFLLPGALVMLALSVIYVLATGQPALEAALLGLKAAVLALVVQAVLRIAGRALKTGFDRALAIGAFFAIALFNVSFPWLVATAAGLGVLAVLFRGGPKDAPALSSDRTADRTGPLKKLRGSLLAGLIWGLVWIAPLVAVWLSVGPDHVLWDIGLFFSKLAVVTFGGAYAVLAYMAQEAVQTFGWLRPGEMADALGLAESTPGPLILVTQHVGFLAAFRDPAPFSPLVAGILGAGLTTWVTFAPCFLWIFVLSPWVEALSRAPLLRGGLAALTAAVVGVIASLALWFGLHLLFAVVTPVRYGLLAFSLPDPSSLNLTALALTGLAVLLLLGVRLGVLKTLAVVILAALAVSLWLT